MRAGLKNGCATNRRCAYHCENTVPVSSDRSAPIIQSSVTLYTGSFDGREDGEHNGIGFVEISSISVMRDKCVMPESGLYMYTFLGAPEFSFW